MGETALYQAVEMEKKNQVDTLLLKGANPNISLQDGTTPLHCAVIKGNLDIIKTLLENGAFPNLKSKFFLQTPLHLGIKTKQSEQIIKMLLDYNASTILSDKHGNKPIDYAGENSAIKNMLIEAEASQLGQVSNMNNQNTFNVDDRLNRLITKEDKDKDEEKNKEKEDDLLIVSINPSLKDIISEVNHTENNEVANGSEKKRNKEEDEKDSFHLDTIQTPNEKNTNRIDVNELLSANGNGNDYYDNDNGNYNYNDNYNQEESANEFNDQRSYLNDSLENDYNNNNASNRKKADYISDFPLTSSMKKKSEEEDDMYKKIIMAKRLSFNANNKISYHNKSSNEPTLGDNYLNNRTEQSNHQYNASLKVTPINSQHYSNNNISDRNRSNDNDHLNKTSENELNTKRVNNTHNNTNYYSSFSTQPHSANTNSLQIKKKYLDDNNRFIFPYSNDNDQYGKVSEFTIKNVTTRQISSLQLSKMKKWLNSIDLIEHLDCFIDNEMCDIDRLKQVMINYNTKLKYDDFERIGIKKPGHIYRILTKLEIDLHSIDNKVIQFILPNSNHNRTNSIETKLNLKISEEYCCGCQNFIAKKTKLDLAMFLRKKTLQHIYPNFLHNGFDWLEYVLLQMYTDYMFKEEILEDMMHIYDVDDRNKVMKCLIDEMKRINLFVNSKEYLANIQNYKYGSIDLEKEEQEKPCQPCVIY